MTAYLYDPNGEPPRGLRERKKARAREAIVAAALRLFSEKGFERTTVDEIAAAADVARRTFFRYFPTKEAVLWPDREHRLARFRADLDDVRPGEAPFAVVRRALLSMAVEYMAHREELLAVQRIVEASPALLALDRAFDRDWEAALLGAWCPSGTGRSRDRSSEGSAPRATGRAVGAPPPGSAPRAPNAALPSAEHRRARVLAAATMGVIRATLAEWLDGGCKTDLVALGQETLDMLESGLGTTRRRT